MFKSERIVSNVMEFSTPLARQLGNSIEVLKTAIENSNTQCWNYGDPPFYQIVFHAVYSLDMYFSTFNPGFTNLPHDYHLPDQFKPLAELGFFDKEIQDFENPSEILTKQSMLNFLDQTRDRIRGCFSSNIAKQFEEHSGFPWLNCSKFELIIHNIRHLMGHTGVLNGYLKDNNCEITGWIGRAEL